MDVIFYFVMSLLIATVLCYVIFSVKNSFLASDIRKEGDALKTVGTDEQKQYEQSVINYQKKISDFSGLMKNHQFASNVFAFMQQQTLPDIWFNQFTLDEKNSAVTLSGESDSMDAFSRQVAGFEKSKYVKSVGTLNSSLGDSARIEFNVDLALDQGIFSYLADMTPISETTTSLEQSVTQGNQNNSGNQATVPNSGATTNQPAATQQTPPVKSSQKFITSFHLLLSPEVIGTLDEINYTVTLNIPHGTDLKNLIPSVSVSPGATVSPASNVSQDFENPVTYIVTAEDGSSQKYTVTANVLPEAAQKSSQSGFYALILVVVVIVIVIAGVLVFLRSRKKMNGQKSSKNLNSNSDT